MTFPIDAFVDSLQGFDTGRDLFNPWRDVTADDAHDNMPQVRRDLLRQHLWCAVPRLIIVNDTNNYYGSRQTGVPLTSEYLILNRRVPRLQYDQRMTNTANMFADPSAGLFWQLLPQAGLAEQTLCWDVLPFQPYRASSGMNRKPSDDEFALGKAWLQELLGAFPDAAVLGVGAQVRDTLRQLGRNADWVKHPSRGGAGTLKAILNDIASRDAGSADPL